MNNKILNWSIVISLLTAYFLPGTSPDVFAFNYGYPFDFMGFGMNIVVIYFIIYMFNKFINKNITR